MKSYLKNMIAALYTLKIAPHQIETFQSSDSILNRILEINKEFLAKKITAVQIEKQNGEILMVTIGSDYHLLNYYPKDIQILVWVLFTQFLRIWIHGMEVIHLTTSILDTIQKDY